MRLQVAQVQVLTIMIVIVSLCVRRAHALQSSLVRRGSHHHHHHHPSIIMRNSRGLVVVGVVNTKRFASSSSMSTEDNSDSAAASKSETPKTKTTVAIIGSGAVGGYYGSRLWEAGHDVKFHMRGDHYKHSKANGLVVTVSNIVYHVVMCVCVYVCMYVCRWIEHLYTPYYMVSSRKECYCTQS